MAHQTERTHELVRVDTTVAVHVEHVEEDLDLAVTALEEVLETLCIKAVVVRVQLKLLPMARRQCLVRNKIQNWALLAGKSDHSNQTVTYLSLRMYLGEKFESL